MRKIIFENGATAHDPTIADVAVSPERSAAIDRAKAAKRWICDVDLGPIEMCDRSNREEERRSAAGNCIRDIEPYVAVAMRDPKDPSKPLVIHSRSQHRAELAARGLIEVGNEHIVKNPKTGYSEMHTESVRPAFERALDQMGYNRGARTLKEIRRRDKFFG